jgi:UDP:flavonoid glycosyltransferase YjiC (YdhE family)
MARSVERLGAAFVASDHDAKQIVAGLDAVIQDDRYSRAARAFADKYSAHRSVETLARVLDRIESLASTGD